MRVDEITKGWSPEQYMQEVSKVRTYGVGEASKEFEGKPAECGIQK